MLGEEVLILIVTWIVGSIIGSTIVTILTNKFIIPRIMKHKDVSDTLQLLKDIRDYLKQILEYQKKQ